MKKQIEQVLFYQFQKGNNLDLAQKTLHRLGIKTKILHPDDWRQKIGFLLGAPGFKEAKDGCEDSFTFPHEVMIFQNIRNKRLEHVLQELKEAGVPSVQFKSVVTPFNILWTLKRLCQTMEKEHGVLKETQ